MIVKACALALRDHPRANGSYRDGRFELHSRVNVGVAVAAGAEDPTGGALVVPTVFDADTKALGEIARETRTLAERVRDGSITPPELSGGTFTVSNLGMYGIAQLHRDRQPAAGGDPRGRRGRAAGRRAQEEDRGAPHDERHARVRPPHPLRGRRGAVPGAHPRAAGRAGGADAVAPRAQLG